MSKLSVGRAVIASAMALGIGLLPGSCVVIYVDGNCAETEDCHTEWNYNGRSTLCVSGRCQCPSSLEKPCCPGGDESCGNDVFDCRPARQCDPAIPVPVGSDCLRDDQCAGPPDSLCGAARCVAGKCEIKIAPGPIKSQFPGDCRVLVCSFDGRVESQPSPSDVPWDGNACTFDSCTSGGKPSNTDLPDGYPCPDQAGICVSGKCRDCSNGLEIGECDGCGSFGTVEISTT
jgi:hypothetical protein